MKITNIAMLFGAYGPFGRGMIEGIRRYGLERPWWRVHYWGSPTESIRKTLQAAVKDWNIHGVIVSLTDHFLLAPIQALKVPVVDISGAIDPAVSTVVTDAVDTGKLVAKHFFERGYQHFGFCGAPRRLYSRERYEGFAGEIRRHGFACTEHGFPGGTEWHGLDLNGLAKWLEDMPKPAGIMAATDEQGRHVLMACERLGLRVPEDIAVVGVGDDEVVCTACNPSLSSVNLMFDRVGYAASALLEKLIGGEKCPKKPLYLKQGQVVLRHSSDVLGVNDPYVSNAIRFIRQHAHESIEVQDILGTVSVSRSSLDRRFRNLLGRTLSEHLWFERVEKAKMLLARTDTKALQVAEAAGFRNYTIFFNMFRRFEGISPKEYRQRFRMTRPMSVEPSK